MRLRKLVAGLALLGGFLTLRSTKKGPSGTRDPHRDDRVDTFPASDAPNWTLGDDPPPGPN
jgi:hypothetical protein